MGNAGAISASNSSEWPRIAKRETYSRHGGSMEAERRPDTVASHSKNKRCATPDQQVSRDGPWACGTKGRSFFISV
jgi:hypothetical protein